MLSRLLILFLLTASLARAQHVITDDLDRFYAAFDAIHGSDDTSRHAALLDTLFIQPASPGPQAMFAARRYTPAEYLGNIRDYPKFWQSLRNNTQTIPQHAGNMQLGVDKLRQLYPELRPADIYFTVGAFRSGGTITDGMVLIGSEISLGDSTTDVSEFRPEHEWLQTLYTDRLGPELVFSISTNTYIPSR